MGFNLPPIKMVLGIGKYDLSQCIQLKRGYIDTLYVHVTFIGKDGKPFIIPPGSTAKVRMLKPDNHKVLDDTENNGTVTGNTVTFKITNQMQAYPGNGALEIILFNSGQTVTSSTCGIKIIENVHDDSGIESTNEWLTVLNTLAELEEKIQDAAAATNNANAAAEELRKETLIIYLPDVPNYASIATTYPSPQIGWATVAIDTSIRWRWSGTEWKNIGTVQNIGIANNTTPGTIKGGGNITIAANGQADYNMIGDIKDTTVTFVDATVDETLTSGSKLSVLTGLIKYKLSNIITGKIDKTSIKTTDTVNDPNSPLGANVGYTHGQEIGTIKAGLANKAPFNLYFKEQAGWLTSTTYPYSGSDYTSLKVYSCTIIGERVLTTEEVNLLNNYISRTTKGLQWMTSDSTLLTILTNKMVAIELTI